MKTKLMFIIMLVLLCAAPALAQNVSFAEMGFAGPQTIQIYTANGTILGTYNTSTNAVSLPSEDIVILFKPEGTDHLRNPENLIDGVFTFVETYFITILFVMFLIGVLYMGRR